MLFDAQEIENNRPDNHPSGSVLQTDSGLSFWDKTQSKIAETLSGFDLKDGSSVHFYSNGTWSMHDLLFYFLKKTPAAKVYLTTWAISEIAMRQLYTFLKDGLISELYAIIDYRNTSRKPAELEFIKQNATKIQLSKCHAKVTVIDHPDRCITIVTSANYTRNPRLEAGVITVGRQVGDFHKEWIIEELEHECN